MSAPLVVSLPHRLGKQEALSRLKAGLSGVRQNYSQLLTIEQEDWNGDTLQFRVRALAQAANGSIQVFEDTVRLEVSLPWLLARFADRLTPAIQRSGTLMLERK